MSTSPSTSGRLLRRTFLAAAAATLCLEQSAQGASSAETADPECPRCGGVGRIPFADAKPFVWLLGTPQPKPDTIVGEQFCPVCQPAADPATLAIELQKQIDAALEKHQQWEERTGWNLVCIITRHATVHTQLTVAQTRQVGTALESLLLQIKTMTGSLLLANTRPDKLELMLLWEKPSWDKFRKVMEGLYTPKQLGPSWPTAAQHNAYDHFAIAHTYETRETIRARPPPCGAVFIAGRRQLSMATNWRAPFWLAEGFAAWCDHAVHKTNRWYTVYDIKPVPPGDWMASARKLASESKQRPWQQMRQRELPDWTADDHVQTTAMAAFLFESAPAKFQELVKRLKSGDPEDAALEEAYRVTLDELEQRYTRWVLARR